MNVAVPLYQPQPRECRARNRTAATNLLNAFINQVNDFQSCGILTDVEADDLSDVALATSIILATT